MLSCIHYSNIAGLMHQGDGSRPRVEETLTSYLSPEAPSPAKAPKLPTKPIRTTSALVGKAYSAAGQAVACLHTMSILQAYQVGLLKDIDEGEEVSRNDFVELRTDLSLCATKELYGNPGNLSKIKERAKSFLLDAPLSSSP